MVVDESVEMCVREPDGDTERKIQRLGRFWPPIWHNTLRPMSFGGLYCICVYTKIWEEEHENLKLPGLCHQEID